MRFVAVLLAILPAALCQDAFTLQPEDKPRPAIRGLTTIAGRCDPSQGAGQSFSGKQGTLKVCSKACQDSPNCQGLNHQPDTANCVLFNRACQNTVQPGRNAPTENFYLKGEIACSTSTVGNEFYLAFMANRVAQPKNLDLEIWVTQDKKPEGTTVTLESDPSMGISKSVSIPYKKAVLLKIPYTWKISDKDNGVTIEQKALKLSSEDDFVFYGVNKEYFTADAFLGIPSRALGTQYVANCHWPPFYNCEFAITPAQNDTTVTITLPKKPTTNAGNWAKAPTGVNKCAIPYNGQTYTNGDTFTIKLSQFQAAQIQDPCDLTGTLIQSDKPIAVWTGDSRVNIGDSPSRDHQVEQLFSTDTWGTDCAAWPTPNRVDGLVDYWVITAALDNTVVRVDSSEKSQTSYTLNAGESVRFPANSVKEWQRFSSDKKFQAMQYASSAVDNSIHGDPSETVCIPSDQFGFGYTFVTPTGVSSPYDNYLTLITTKGAENGFRLDGVDVTGVQWRDVPNSKLVGGYVTLDNTKQQFRIEHKVRGTTFEAYIYGAGDRESIAYPTGACIKALGECVKSTMFIADGKDNDCDGVIDEELFDGIDNDLDGQIDEDCYAIKPKPQVQDRCPEVKTAQACYNSQLQLSCDSGSIKVISAHFGRLSRAGELQCGSENPIEKCSGADADCGWNDISGYVSTICDGNQACNSAVNYFSLGNLYAPSSCPTCSLYAHVQYVCLTAKELSFGSLSGSNYVASSSAGGSSGTCSAGQDSSSCYGCNSAIAGAADINGASNADYQSNARRGWRPAQCDQANSWLQVDLGGQFSVGYYAIQGCVKSDMWITQFAIAYSQDGTNWQNIRDASGNVRVFDGNVDAITIKVCTLFIPNVVARWLRIFPVAWKGGVCAHIDFGHNTTLQGCSVPAIVNSNFAQGGSVGFGTPATVQCNKEWALESGATSYQLQCGSDGNLQGNPSPCSKFLTCPDIPQVDGGYSMAANNKIGSVVHFMCKEGRTLRGADSITCNANGRWSGDAPTCQ